MVNGEASKRKYLRIQVNSYFLLQASDFRHLTSIFFQFKNLFIIFV